MTANLSVVGVERGIRVPGQNFGVCGMAGDGEAAKVNCVLGARIQDLKNKSTV